MGFSSSTWYNFCWIFANYEKFRSWCSRFGVWTRFVPWTMFISFEYKVSFSSIIMFSSIIIGRGLVSSSDELCCSNPVSLFLMSRAEAKGSSFPKAYLMSRDPMNLFSDKFELFLIREMSFICVVLLGAGNLNSLYSLRSRAPGVIDWTLEKLIMLLTVPSEPSLAILLPSLFIWLELERYILYF